MRGRVESQIVICNLLLIGYDSSVEFTREVPNMASVFKRRWSKTVNGERVTGESKVYTIEYTDEDGIVQRVRGFTDKTASETRALKLETDAAQVRSGMLPRKALDAAAKALWCKECRSTGINSKTQEPCPCIEKIHLSAYRQHLEDSEVSAGHLAKTVQRVADACDGCKFDNLRDLDADKLERWLAKKRRGKRFGYQSSNHYLRAVRMFMSWLIDKGAITADPFRRLEFLNEELDRRLVRRAVSTEDFHKLLKATRDSGATVLDLDAEARYLLYSVAGFTGLRAGELSKLNVSDFDFEGNTVTVLAVHAKGQKTDSLPLHLDLARLLQAWMKGRGANEPAWPRGKWIGDTASVLREDLARCGIPHTDAQGRVFDFHSIRGQFIVELARQGTHPRTAQLLARHSSIDLTMNSYTNLNRIDLVQAVESLPSPIPSAPDVEPQTLKATGTDGRADRKVRSEGGQLDRKGGRGRTSVHDREAGSETTQQQAIERHRTDTDGDGRNEGTGPARIRTENQGIMSHERPFSAHRQNLAEIVGNHGNS